MNRPNILLILTDQHRYDCVGANGCTRCETPFLDQLARDGTRFTRAYSVCPLCTPARAAIYSGLLPHRTGVIRNTSQYPRGRGPSLEEVPSLAERLNGVGYRCLLEGKWHAGALSASQCGFEAEEYPGYGDPAQSTAYAEYLSENNLERPRVEWIGHGYDHRLGLAGIASGPEEAQIPAYLGTRATRAIKGFEGDTPFFLAVNFWGPHAPYIPCEPYASKYDPESIPPWPNFEDSLEDKPPIYRRWRDAMIGEGGPLRTWEECSRWAALYFGFVNQIDTQIGRILEALESSGHTGDTVVLFSSDHGDLLGAHGGMHDKDGTLCEELMHVPLIIRDPGVEPGGGVVDSPVSNIDLAATILDYGKADYSGLDSRSLRSCIYNPTTILRDFVYAQFFGSHFHYEARMILLDGWKYIFHPGATDELYDLKEDPWELHNRIGDSGAEFHLARCRQCLLSVVDEVDDPLQIVRHLFAEPVAGGTTLYRTKFRHAGGPVLRGTGKEDG